MSEASLPEIEAVCKSRFNQPILCGLEVVRLIGYAEDDIDCYLVVHCPKRGVYWHTAVGGYILLHRLKDQARVQSTSGEDWDDLGRLDSLLTTMGVPPASEYSVYFVTTKKTPQHELA